MAAFVLALVITTGAAGCVNAPTPDVETAAVDETSSVLAAGPTTEKVPGDIQLSAATPVRSINYGGTFSTVVELHENVTGYVIELEWSAATPASESLSMWVRPAGVGNIGVPPDPSLVTGTEPPLAQVDGASPLRVAIPADAFPEPGEYEIVVRASAEPIGAAANQPFTLHVSTFEDVAFDDAYSALGGPEAA